MKADLVLTRFDFGDQGTFGRLTLLGLFSGELPDRGNAPRISCIPEGIYRVEWTWSPKLKRFTYRVLGVPRRDGILLHPANLMGDATKGWQAQLEGCISPGVRLGYMEFRGRKQKAILVSRPAVRRLEEAFGRKPFLLEVRNA